jgi:uncharacterized Zn finger protein
MSHDDIFFSRYGPRTARGGIKSQTSRGSFGKNWWAQRWIQVLESFDLGGRLARGRTYARQGQVLSIDIQEGAVDSTVQGSRRDPYKVKLRVKTIPLHQWLELSKTAFNQAKVAAKLLAGEMPQDIETLFAAHDLSLFPVKYGDLETECSCPDYSNPCKHIAAVYYLLGEEFDRDPFLIFRMRGMSKEQLIALITKADSGTVQKLKRKSKTKPEPLDLLAEPVIESEAPSEAEMFPLLSDEFWSTESTDELVGPVIIPAVNASLPKRLGNLSFWRSKQALMPTLEQIYKLASERSTKDLSSEKLQE